MEPYIKIRQIIRSAYPKPTIFYPNYGSYNDQVNRVLRVQRVAFQRIFPRYDLSFSETRDTGLGPKIEFFPVLATYEKQEEEYTISIREKNLLKRLKKQIEPYKGQHIDFRV